MEQRRIDPASVIGWGVDADPDNDPTYPMRDISADDKQGLSWQRPSLQPNSVEVLQSTEHNRRPAVFGTSTPPSGISGAIRRRAFHRSEGKWGHWLMLLLADRINVVEGVFQDLGRGKIPNIPAEMGMRSEIRHNLPGLTTKVVIAGVVLTAAIAATRLLGSLNPDQADGGTARRQRSGQRQLRPQAPAERRGREFDTPIATPRKGWQGGP